MHRAAIARNLLAQPQGRGQVPSDARLEARAAFDERQTAQVVLAITQQIENDQRDGLIAIDTRDVVRPEQVDPSLELLESCRRAGLVECDELAVDDERNVRGRTKLFQCAGDRGELRGLLVTEA